MYNGTKTIVYFKEYDVKLDWYSPISRIRRYIVNGHEFKDEGLLLIGDHETVEYELELLIDRCKRIELEDLAA